MTKNLKARISSIIQIIKQYRKGGFILITIDYDNLINLMKGNENEMKLSYGGMSEYNVFLMLKKAADIKDRDDMILMRASDEADYELYKMNNDKK